MLTDHEWNDEERQQVIIGGMGTRPYDLITIRRCSRCGLKQTIIMGIWSYDPPGDTVAGYQLAPPCIEDDDGQLPRG